MVGVLQLRMNSEQVSSYWVFALGFASQALFGARILVQWWLAEKRKENVSPGLFWAISLAASSLFLIYGILRSDVVIIVGQLTGYFIYIRNLQLKHDWNKASRPLQFVIVAFPVCSIVWILTTGQAAQFNYTFAEQNNTLFWFGLTGQLLLNFRFLYQLYYSEKHKESVLPVGFWWMSLAGSISIIAYGIYRHDPVLLAAQGIAVIPYTRNIVLSKTG